MAKIKRIGVLKMAYFGGLYGAFMGLIIAIFYGILFASLGSLIGTFGFVTPSFNFILLLLYPIFLGIGGFLSGLIFTPIMNLILRFINGIELDIEMIPNRSQMQGQ